MTVHIHIEVGLPYEFEHFVDPDVRDGRWVLSTEQLDVVAASLHVNSTGSPSLAQRAYPGIKICPPIPLHKEGDVFSLICGQQHPPEENA